MDDSRPRGMRRAPVWYSVAVCTGLGALIHAIGMAPPLGVTPPLVVSFYGLFLVIWTLPASALLGLVLGFAIRWSRRLVPASRRGRVLVTLGGGLLVAGGFAGIFDHLWGDGAIVVAGCVGFCAGAAVALFLTGSRTAGDSP